MKTVSKRKILHIITGLNFGGAEKLLLNTCAEQVKRGYEVDVVYFEKNSPLKREFLKAGIDVYWINADIILLPLCLIKLILLIRKKNYWVVHTHLPKSGFLGRIAAYIGGSKNIVNTIHNTYEWYISKNLIYKFLRTVDVWLNNCKQSQIIAISHAVKEHVLRGESKINQSKINILYNAINFVEIEKGLREPLTKKDLFLDEEDFLIVNIGRLVEEKGHIYLLRALDRLINTDGLSRIKCIILGRNGNSCNKVRTFIKEHKLENNILLLGSSKNPYKYLKISDLFCMSSVIEGFGIAVLEAFYCQVPVLVSDAGGLPEIVQHGQTGIIVKKGDIITLENEIKNFYFQKYDIHRYIENAAKYVKQNFNIKYYVDKLDSIYQEIIK